MKYYSLNNYLRNTFGDKVYKLSLDGGFTCPNRDGTIDTRGCIFCSEGGSGDFAESSLLSITEQRAINILHIFRHLQTLMHLLKFSERSFLRQ